MTKHTSSNPRPKLMYLAGPGDVIGTFHKWLENRHDASQVSTTYSGQFFDVAAERESKALVISSHGTRRRTENGAIRVEDSAVPFRSSRSALMYHAGQLLYAFYIYAKALRFRPDAVVAGMSTHWFLLTPLRLLGVRIIPTLHCAFWPAGHRPNGKAHRLIDRLNGFFWRRCVQATIAVSPECERQVHELTGVDTLPVYQSRAQYDPAVFAAAPEGSAWEDPPFRLYYAGRIEAKKGVFDLLEAARLLEARSPGAYCWDICGDGPDLPALKQQAAKAGLGHVMAFHGQLPQGDVLPVLAQAHAVVVPTTSAFAEGLNKVVIEGVLARKPVVTSVLSNALDVAPDAIQRANPDDPESYADGIERLANDSELYETRKAASKQYTSMFTDETNSWAMALRRALEKDGSIVSSRLYRSNG